MSEHPLSESSWRRARDDTVLAFHTIRLWVVFVAWEGVLMFVPSLMTTVSISRWEFAGIQAGIFFGGMLMLLGAVFLVSLLFTPYRQRNEARDLLLAKPKPIPLQNRKDLIEAIIDIKNKAILVSLSADRYIFEKEQGRDAVNQMYDRQIDYNSYKTVREHFKTQWLIAGQTYKRLLTGYLWYIESNIDAYMGFPNAEKPISSILFKASLEDFVEWTINLLDDTVTGLQAPDTEGSHSQ